MYRASLFQHLQPYASDSPERIPKANVDIRWPGMSQDFQYLVDTPGKDWEEYGRRRRGGSSNPRGPTDPQIVYGFRPYPLSAVYDGSTIAPVGTPQNLQAPRPFTEVSPNPPLDLKDLRWNYHADSPDAQSPNLAVGSTGSSLPRLATSPSAWNPHYERMGALGTVTTYQFMQEYPGVQVADEVTPEEFKSVPNVNPGDKGTIIVHGWGLGLLGKVPRIRDFWADRFLAAGLQATSISGSGFSDFVVRWEAQPQGMAVGPIAIGVVVVAILLVLSWLGPRLSMFLERAAESGGGFIGITGLAIAVAAIGLAIFARSSKRGIL